MKNVFLFSFFSGFCLLMSSIPQLSIAQVLGREVPAVEIKNLDFDNVMTDAVIKNETGGPIIISFWATWCSPCKRELNNIQEVYEEWQEETGVKLVAVSIDDSRNMSKVPTYAYGQDWDYLVLMDPNHEFKRAMNVHNVPHTFLLDKQGKVVWQHNAYSPGDEDELYRLVTLVANDEPID